MDGSNHSLDQSGHNSQLFSRLTNSRVELAEIAVNFAAERVPSNAFLASTKCGNPSSRQYAARLRPFHRLSDETGDSDVNVIR